MRNQVWGRGADGSRGQHSPKFPARSSRLLDSEDRVLSLWTPSPSFPGKKKSKSPCRLSVLEPNSGVSVSMTTTQPRKPLHPKMEKLDWGKKINSGDDFRTYQRMNRSCWAQSSPLHVPLKTSVFLCQKSGSQGKRHAFI